jgi:hypothetical protein
MKILEPNTSLVKWVDERDLHEEPDEEDIESSVPVIPLADLTALVEGLNHLLYANHKPCLGCDGCNKARQALTQLEAHRKEG